jgi:hypothetical protein
MGERILQEGKADFIGMTRRLLADPELPNKVAEGRLDDIAPCTRCLSCIEAIHTNYIPGVPGKSFCRINASLAKEREFEIRPSDKKKNVMVLAVDFRDGGSKGSCLKGHDVTLYEKEHQLGGSACGSHDKGLDIEDFLPSFVIKETDDKAGVKIILVKR